MGEPTGSLFLRPKDPDPFPVSPVAPKPSLNLRGLLERSQNEPLAARTPGTRTNSGASDGNHFENVFSKLVDKVDDDQFDPSSSITVDISGKLYQISNSQLFMHPESLLATSERERYLDPDTGHYFFDRNRQAFEFVLEYYQNGGKLRTPDFLCERLLDQGEKV